MNAKLGATIIAVVFVLVGLIGFFPNPLVSPTGIFAVNTGHNLVHIVSGLAILAGAYSNFGAAMTLKVFGAVYGLVAILGFILGPGMLLGFIMINAADNWLHILLAIAIGGAGFVLPEERPLTA